MRRLTGIVLLAAITAGCGGSSSGSRADAPTPTVPSTAQATPPVAAPQRIRTDALDNLSLYSACGQAQVLVHSAPHRDATDQRTTISAITGAIKAFSEIPDPVAQQEADVMRSLIGLPAPEQVTAAKRVVQVCRASGAFK